MKHRSYKTRKGFSLVELVVVILIIAILAVAVFAGGSAIIKKSQVSRTTSDLHNFAVAVESFMNENPKVANIIDDAGLTAAGLDAALNANLPADYQLTAVTGRLDGNITYTSAPNPIVFKSVKTDAWDNPYYVFFDYKERSKTASSEFYITVVSAGADAKTALAGAIGGDDIFVLTQYQDGNVSSVTYSVATDKLMASAAGDGKVTVITDKKLATYAGVATACPVNF